MKLSTTIFLLVAVLAAAAYIYFVERHGPTTDDLSATAHLLVTLEPETITGIEITNGSSTTRLRWTEKQSTSPAPETPQGTWTVTEPFEDRADQAFANNLIGLVADLRIHERIAGAHLLQGTDPFDATAREITLKSASENVAAKLLIGKPAPFKNSAYAKNLYPGDDAGAIYVVSSESLPLLMRPVAEVRDPKIFPFPLSQITRLRVHNPQGQLEVARVDASETAQWWLTKPLKTRADNGIVNDTIATFTSTSITAVPENTTGTSAASVSFDEPVATVTAWVSDQAPAVTVKFAGTGTAQKPVLFAKIDGRTPVFEVPATLLGSLTLVPNDLRDDTLAAIDPNAVKSIVMKSPDYPDGYPLYRKGQAWWLYRNGQNELANSTRVNDLVKSLNESRILEFTDDAAADLAPYGLDSPFRQLTFSSAEVSVSADGTGNLPVTSDNSVTLRFGKGDRNRIYANFEGQPFVYTVDPNLLNVLHGAPLEWRTLLVTGFNAAFELRSLTFNEGALPPIVLTRDPTDLSWTATRPGVDLTADIDQSKAAILAENLGGFYAADWLPDRGEILTQLAEDASLQIDIALERTDPKTGEPTPQSITLRFAPAGAGAISGYYYGTRLGFPEVFIITKEDYQTLTASLLKDHSPRPPTN